MTITTLQTRTLGFESTIVCDLAAEGWLNKWKRAPDCRLLQVQRSLWRCQEQEPKTTNAVLVVDIPEVLASKLRDYLRGVNGYLFATTHGKPLQQRNILRVLHGTKRVGFHAFRRFRLTWLRKNGVPKDLERYWMGHAPEEVGVY